MAYPCFQFGGILAIGSKLRMRFPSKILRLLAAKLYVEPKKLGGAKMIFPLCLRLYDETVGKMRHCVMRIA